MIQAIEHFNIQLLSNKQLGNSISLTDIMEYQISTSIRIEVKLKEKRNLRK